MPRDVLLVNMGGPETTEEIRPYLRAIFSDRHILPLPKLPRLLLRELIVWRRTPVVRERYEALGGGSPLPEWTRRQAGALREALAERGEERRVEHAFRYTDPSIEKGLRRLQRDGSDRILLLPLFPHHTSAMTGSVVEEGVRRASRLGLDLVQIPAWGLHPDVVALQRTLLRAGLAEAGEGARVLFVAHGIPQRNVDAGEDYPEKVRENARRIMEPLTGVDWSFANQSRLGPVEWTRPYLEDEVARLARAAAAPLVVMPLSFVADCLETLHDLDEVAARQAREAGVPRYVRVPAFNDDPRFAHALAQIIREMDDDR